MISVPSVRPSVRPFVRSQRIFSKSDEPNFLKFGIQPLWGKSKRMSKPFFDFRKFRPWRAKKRPFLALFWPFLQFFGLKNFFRERIFLFFNMMFFGIFRSDLQKFVKKGSKFDPPGPKNGHFLPFFRHFCSFSDLEIFLVNEFF